jgi:hypothetical protein
VGLSAFRPLGLLRLSSQVPIAKRIYDAQVEALGGQFDLSDGTHAEATIFARSLGLARTYAIMHRAARQRLPKYVLELLPAMEDEYGLVPGPRDSIAQRQAAFAAAKLLPGGASRVNVENALRTLLGDAFVAYRTTKSSEIVNYPTNCGDSPMNLQLPSVPRRLIRIKSSVSTGAQVVSYDALDDTTSIIVVPTQDGGRKVHSQTLLVGDVLVVQPETLGQAERVTVTAVGVDTAGSSPGQFAHRTFTATFAKSHDVDCVATTQPFPWWTSTQRQSLIVLTTEAATDPETRRKVNELMHRIARDVSTWAITDGSPTVTNGPFKVGVGKLGVTSIGAVALP